MKTTETSIKSTFTIESGNNSPSVFNVEWNGLDYSFLTFLESVFSGILVEMNDLLKNDGKQTGSSSITFTFNASEDKGDGAVDSDFNVKNLSESQAASLRGIYFSGIKKGSDAVAAKNLK